MTYICHIRVRRGVLASEKKLVQSKCTVKGRAGGLKVFESKFHTDAVSHTVADGRRVKFEQGGKMEATEWNFANKDEAVTKVPTHTHALHTYTWMHLHWDEWEV